MEPDTFIACHACDMLHRREQLSTTSVATCSRCRTVLYRSRKNSLDRTLAMAICGLILFVIANAYPFLTLNIEGKMQETTLISGVVELNNEGKPALALLVLLTAIAFPLVELAGLTYLLLPLRYGRLPLWAGTVFRAVRAMQPWGMTEVFLLGILVSIAKLADMASIIPGIALYAFLILIFVVAAAAAALNPDIIWEKMPIKS